LSAAVLEIEGVSKSFGGLRALDEVSFALNPGRVHAIIGPNGAGKTTLFNVITGLLKADGGSIRFMGREITDAPPHRINRLGLARTLQIKSVFNGLSVRENLWIAAQNRVSVFRPFAAAGSCRRTARKVDQLLRELDLEPISDQQAGTLSYGDMALLELGIALATEPTLLLLDEPVCGMGPAETEQTVEKIRELSASTNIVIIEHDMQVVFDIADEIFVMAQGSVLAAGTPAEIAADRAVREAYLGDDEDA
jgi:branched-chain amino acid transport system ATP-binding protein